MSMISVWVTSGIFTSYGKDNNSHDPTVPHNFFNLLWLVWRVREAKLTYYREFSICFLMLTCIVILSEVCLFTYFCLIYVKLIYEVNLPSLSSVVFWIFQICSCFNKTQKQTTKQKNEVWTKPWIWGVVTPLIIWSIKRQKILKSTHCNFWASKAE